MWLENAVQNIEQRKKRGVVGLTGAGVMMRLMAELNNSGIKCNYHLIKHNDFWNSKVKRSGGSYNDNNQHWSIRQKIESPFIDL